MISHFEWLTVGWALDLFSNYGISITLDGDSMIVTMEKTEN